MSEELSNRDYKRGIRGLSFRKEDPKSKPAKSYFLGIGINKYHHLNILQNAVRDVQDLKEILTQKYQFEPENSITLIDEKATLDNIIETLDNLTRELTENDNLLIYYSGHSHFNRTLETSYWVPVDAKPGQTSRYISTSLLRDYIKAMSCKHIFLISDAALSGSLFVRAR